MSANTPNNQATRAPLFDSIKCYSDYFYAIGIKMPKSPKKRSELLHEYIYKYKCCDLPEEERAHCLDTIVALLIYLVAYIGKNKVKYYELFDDLIQNSTIAIMDALNNYDVTKGTNFVSYLAKYLTQANSQTYRSNYVVTTPSRKTKELKEAMRASEDDEEVYNLTYNNGEDTLSNTMQYLDEVKYESPELMCDPDYAEELHKKEILMELEFLLSPVSDYLSQEEKHIITKHYGVFGSEKSTLDEIAKQLRAYRSQDITTARICQIAGEAKTKIKKYFKRLGITKLDIF